MICKTTVAHRVRINSSCLVLCCIIQSACSGVNLRYPAAPVSQCMACLQQDAVFALQRLQYIQPKDLLVEAAIYDDVPNGALVISLSLVDSTSSNSDALPEEEMLAAEVALSAIDDVVGRTYPIIVKWLDDDSARSGDQRHFEDMIARRHALAVEFREVRERARQERLRIGDEISPF